MRSAYPYTQISQELLAVTPRLVEIPPRVLKSQEPQPSTNRLQTTTSQHRNQAPRVPESQERRSRFVTREDLRIVDEESRVHRRQEKRLLIKKRLLQFLSPKSYNKHHVATHISSLEQPAAPSHPESRQEHRYVNNRMAVLGANKSELEGTAPGDDNVLMEDDTLANEDTVAEVPRIPEMQERRLPFHNPVLRLPSPQPYNSHRAAPHAPGPERQTSSPSPGNGHIAAVSQRGTDNRTSAVLGANNQHPLSLLLQLGVPPFPFAAEFYRGSPGDGSMLTEESSPKALAEEDPSDDGQLSTALQNKPHSAMGANMRFELPRIRRMSSSFGTLFEDNRWTELVPSDPSNQPMDFHRPAAVELKGKDAEAISSSSNRSYFLRRQDGFLHPNWHVPTNYRPEERVLSTN